MLDIELRSRQLEKGWLLYFVRARLFFHSFSAAFSRFSNVRFVPFRHELLLSRVGAKNAFSALNLTWTVSSDDFIAEKRLVDAQHKVKRRFAIDTTLDYCRKRASFAGCAPNHSPLWRVDRNGVVPCACGRFGFCALARAVDTRGANAARRAATRVSGRIHVD